MDGAACGDLAREQPPYVGFGGGSEWILTRQKHHLPAAQITRTDYVRTRTRRLTVLHVRLRKPRQRRRIDADVGDEPRLIEGQVFERSADRATERSRRAVGTDDVFCATMRSRPSPPNSVTSTASSSSLQAIISQPGTSSTSAKPAAATRSSVSRSGCTRPSTVDLAFAIDGDDAASGASEQRRRRYADRAEPERPRRRRLQACARFNRGRRVAASYRPRPDAARRSLRTVHELPPCGMLSSTRSACRYSPP